MNIIKNLTSLCSLTALASIPAHAGLILDTGITSTFDPTGTTTTHTVGNDYALAPEALYFGQLQATDNGYVEFFYIGKEAGYVNTLLLDGLEVHSTEPYGNDFSHSQLVGAVEATAGQYVDFGFCTNGDEYVDPFGRCLENNDDAALTAQFNHGDVGGYRSIGYRSLTSFDSDTGELAFSDAQEESNLWMFFWDDSGGKNDDNHDDYIGVARFVSVPVPEPAISLLLGAGLIAASIAGRRRSRGKAVAERQSKAKKS